MAYKCDICGNPIEKWQGWHATGQRLVHMQCEWGRTPATHSTSYFYGGEKARMTLGDEGISPKKKEDSQPPLGGGGKGNHRTKRKHVAKHEDRAYHQVKPIPKEEFDEV